MPAKDEKAYVRALLDVLFNSPRGWLCLPIVVERVQMRRGFIFCLISLQMVTVLCYSRYLSSCRMCGEVSSDGERDENENYFIFKSKMQRCRVEEASGWTLISTVISAILVQVKL